MDKIKELLESLEKIKSVWYKKAGLALGLLLGLLIGGEANASLLRLMQDINVAVPKYLSWGLFLLAEAFIAGLWFQTRRLPKFADDDIGILLAIDSKEEKIKETLEKIWAQLQDLLDHYGLVEQFKIKKLPPNWIPEDTPTAVRIREMSNASLIIWGRALHGKIESKEVVTFPSASFTFKTPKLPPEQFFQLAQDLSLSFLGRKWLIREESDLVGVGIVSQYMFEISTYIIGVCLILFGRWGQAVRVLESLCRKFETTPENIMDSLKTQFFTRIKELTSIALANQWVEQGFKYNEGGDTQRLEEIKLRAERIKSLNPRLTLPFMVEAIYYFFKSDIGAAKNAIGQAISKNPNDGTPYLSKAFLDFESEKFRRGLDSYKNASKRTISARVLFQVAEFIEEHLKVHPEKIQFHFALGWINKVWLDEEIARKELQKFVELAKDSSYKELAEEANKILKEIEHKDF